MDLNWLYFHTTNVPSGAAGNYSRTPWLPPFEGEGWYENENSTTPLQLREQSYWAVLSGAYLGNGGFGNDPMWYFGGGRMVETARRSWQSQLTSPGAIGMMHFGRLFRSREHWKLAPDLEHSVMTGGYDSRSPVSAASEHVHDVVHGEQYRLGSLSAATARTSDGQTIVAYIPNGSAATVTIAMDKIVDTEGQAKCWWFNPRDGSSTLLGVLPAQGDHRFTPPDKEDWVLVIDSNHANLPAPGTKEL
jgi:hypothetical protein